MCRQILCQMCRALPCRPHTTTQTTNYHTPLRIWVCRWVVCTNLCNANDRIAFSRLEKHFQQKAPSNWARVRRRQIRVRTLRWNARGTLPYTARCRRSRTIMFVSTKKNHARSHTTLRILKVIFLFYFIRLLGTARPLP